MLADLVGTLSRLSEATKLARRASLLMRDEDRSEIEPTLAFNELAHQLLRDPAKCSPEWRNKVIAFLYHEFLDPDPLARNGYRKGIKIFNSLMARSAAKTQDILDLLRPLRDLVAEFSKWQNRYQGYPGVCLIVAALPLEFRAIVRRFSSIERVVIVGRTGDGARPSLRAFSECMDKEFDEQWSGSPRPFWLLVEGVLAAGNCWAKIGVVLLPQYGADFAQKGIAEAERRLFGFREVMVVGVAGRLHAELGHELGDVIVSGGIYDAGLCKYVTDEKGRIEFINRTLPLQTSKPEYIPSSWSPVLHESPPTNGASNGWMPRVFEGDVVSGSGVVKDADIRTRLEEQFPNSCRAVEMEAHGCCAALDSKATLVRVVKGLCDNADPAKSKEWQPFCADAAAAFAAEYILAVHGSEDAVAMSTAQ